MLFYETTLVEGLRVVSLKSLSLSLSLTLSQLSVPRLFSMVLLCTICGETLDFKLDTFAWRGLDKFLDPRGLEASVIFRNLQGRAGESVRNLKITGMKKHSVAGQPLNLLGLC